jgi:hypothetical protein
LFVLLFDRCCSTSGNGISDSIHNIQGKPSRRRGCEERHSTEKHVQYWMSQWIPLVANKDLTHFDSFQRGTTSCNLNMTLEILTLNIAEYRSLKVHESNNDSQTQMCMPLTTTCHCPVRRFGIISLMYRYFAKIVTNLVTPFHDSHKYLGHTANRLAT